MSIVRAKSHREKPKDRHKGEVNEVKVTPLMLDKKTRKKVTHLGTEIKVIVPSTDKTQRPVSEQEMQQRAQEVEKYLGQKFGGYTAQKATGGYVMRDGKLVEENVIEVTAFADEKKAERNRYRMIKRLHNWSGEWGQESMGFEWEGDMFIVPRR